MDRVELVDHVDWVSAEQPGAMSTRSTMSTASQLDPYNEIKGMPTTWTST